MTFESKQLAVAASALGDDPRLVPALARALGFSGLQFDAWSGGFSITELSGSGRREFLRLLSAQNLKLVGLGVDLGNKGFGLGADVDRLLDRLDTALDSAAGLEARLVCVEAGPLPAPPRLNTPKPKISPDAAGLLILPTMTSADPTPRPPAPPVDPAIYSPIDSALAELGRRADRYGVMMAFRSELSSYAAIERALAAAGCPWFGVDLDPAAVLKDEWDLDELFSRLGSQIRHVRRRDAVAGFDRRTKPAVIGSGSTDWNALMADLAAVDYRGWLTIDPTDLTDRRAAAEVGIKRLALCL